MGFSAHGAKSIQYNNGQLRKKTFFKEIGKSRAFRFASRLDLNTLQRKTSIIIKESTEEPC